MHYPFINLQTIRDLHANRMKGLSLQAIPLGIKTFLVVTLLTLCGCEPTETTVYSVPKETPSTSTTTHGPSPLPGNTGAHASQTPHWKKPEHWAAGRPSAMRKGSYAVNQADQSIDISITTFPGNVGGLLPNINRWRGQVGLSPIDESALANHTTPLKTAFLDFQIIDAEGTAPLEGTTYPQRIITAITLKDGNSWFFKNDG